MNPRKLYMVGCVLFFGGLSLTAWQQVKPWDGDNFFVEPVVRKNVWPVIVEQSEEQRIKLPEFALLMANSNYWVGLVQRGYKQMRAYDIDAEDAKPFRRFADATDLPVLVLVSDDGQVIWSGKLPFDTQEIDAILKRECGL